AQTWADIIGYNVEQAPFSPVELRAFMQGLIDGGPTKSGHRTPAVVVVLPFGGVDEMVVRANYWVVEQVLAAGAHGVALTHARSPGAVRAFVQAARYPQAPPAAGIGEGLRGSGGQGLAAAVWGIRATEYQAKADPWPLNPDGELLLALKVEDRWALPGVDEIVGVPGIAFLEAGPSDLHLSLGYPPPVGNQYAAEVVEARRHIAAAAK
ncbi:MAG: hypothetical protein HY701_07005, partial [Gemmatimonadetes bacterium]|nr:hypothetical protein [Gemmatimonadota bacterium]